MDEQETNQLDDIHAEVQGSHAQLGAINERTRNMESKLENIENSVSDNEDDIDDLESKVKRNSTIINAVTIGLSGVTLWVADKLTRLKGIL